MFRFFFSAIGTFLLAGAMATAIVDAYASFKMKGIVFNGLSSLCHALFPDHYETFLSFLNARLSPNLAHLILKMLDLVPDFLILVAAGAIFLAIAAKPKQKIGFSSR